MVFRVSNTQLQLQDRLFQWSSLTREDHDNIFKIADHTKRPYEFKNNVHMAVTIEFELDLTVIDR